METVFLFLSLARTMSSWQRDALYSSATSLDELLLPIMPSTSAMPFRN